MTSETRNIILYVEDDFDDLFIVQQAFEKYHETIAVVHAHNGFVALECLQELQAKGLPPCLVILDMNMPGMDGRETLIRMRQSTAYNNMPVVIFTTSSHQAEKEFAQKWGAEFVTKPLVYSELEKLVQTFVSKIQF
jgi:CheY-like chemotaxis protein